MSSVEPYQRYLRDKEALLEMMLDPFTVPTRYMHTSTIPEPKLEDSPDITFSHELPKFASDGDLVGEGLSGRELITKTFVRPEDFEPYDEDWVPSLMLAWQNGAKPVPVIVWPNGVLLTGRHRLLAAKKMGWTQYPAYVVHPRPDAQADHWDVSTYHTDIITFVGDYPEPPLPPHRRRSTQ